MSETLAPDHALQSWRDQIEQNNRLQHQIEGMRDDAMAVGRELDAAVFSSDRYKALYEIERDKANYFTRAADQRAAALDALGSLATDMARSLTSFAGRCIDAARADVVLPPQQPAPILPATPPAPPATPPVPPIKPPTPIAGAADDDKDIPLFLQPGADHVTPLPAVTP
jgi:hypothetical protein